MRNQRRLSLNGVTELWGRELQWEKQGPETSKGLKHVTKFVTFLLRHLHFHQPKTPAPAPIQLPSY